MHTMRMQVYGHLQQLDISFYDRNPVGRLMTRVTTDVDALNDMFTSGVVTVFGDGLTLVGIMVAMLWMSWRLALVAFLVLPMIAWTAHWFRVNARESYRRVRGLVARLNAFLQEHLTGMATVQLFGREARTLDRFDAINREHRDANMASIFYYAVFYPLIELSAAVSGALIIWVGGGWALRGTISIGVLVAFLQYSRRFFTPISDLSEKFNIMQAAMAASERIFSLLDTPVVIALPARRRSPRAGAARPDRVRSRLVRLQRRGVRAARRLVRRRTRRAHRHRRRDRVGQDDAHQFAAAVLRRHEGPDSRGRGRRPRMGSVGTARTLRPRAPGRAPVLGHDRGQHPTGRLAADERRHPARRRRRSRPPVHRRAPRRLPRHRRRARRDAVGRREAAAVVCARASRSTRACSLLDEATSSIDTATEALIEDALHAIMAGRTVVAIAHRLSTIQDMDRILVFSRGEMVESGMHQELVARRGVYYRLYQLQYREGAAAVMP